MPYSQCVTGWGTGDGFQTLATLNMAINQLNGTLPSTWGTGTPPGMPVLRFLNVSHNFMTGSLPAQWGNVPLSLTGLDVGNNTFAGAQHLHVCSLSHAIIRN